MRELDSYMRAVYRIPMITREEEAELARRYRAGDKKAGERIVTANLRFAVKMAHRYARCGAPLEDLVQQANEGMLIAVTKFDPSQGIRFITYAAWWIRSRLQQYAIRHTSQVRYGTTEGQRKMFSSLLSSFGHARGADPLATDDEVLAVVADKLGVSHKEARESFHRLTTQDISLSAPVRAHSGTELQGTLASDEEAPDELAERRERMGDLAKRLRQCTRNPRERLVVERRLLTPNPVSLLELAGLLGVTRERARQIQEAILDRVRAESGLTRRQIPCYAPTR